MLVHEDVAGALRFEGDRSRRSGTKNTTAGLDVAAPRDRGSSVQWLDPRPPTTWTDLVTGSQGTPRSTPPTSWRPDSTAVGREKEATTTCGRERVAMVTGGQSSMWSGQRGRRTCGRWQP